MFFAYVPCLGTSVTYDNFISLANWGIDYVYGSYACAMANYLVSSNGDVYYGYGGVRPVVYLESKLQLKEGLGTKSDPWKLI